ncbi:MAG: hypothetical protein D6812_13330 [Deltaproteobacteria bacterium]|nr:MAG: hypothetical protein D6812_13330 [Deltaproteobacteria bacterium]
MAPSFRRAGGRGFPPPPMTQKIDDGPLKFGASPEKYASTETVPYYRFRLKGRGRPRHRFREATLSCEAYGEGRGNPDTIRRDVGTLFFPAGGGVRERNDEHGGSR